MNLLDLEDILGEDRNLSVDRDLFPQSPYHLEEPQQISTVVGNRPEPGKYYTFGEIVNITTALQNRIRDAEVRTSNLPQLDLNSNEITRNDFESNEILVQLPPSLFDNYSREVMESFLKLSTKLENVEERLQHCEQMISSLLAG